MAEPQNRRRRFWIDPSFQRRYLVRILLLQILTMAATAVFTILLAFILFSPGFSLGPQWTQILLAFVVIALVLAACLARLGVRISHKICGPVYRIAADLKSFREGAPIRPIKLRKGDDLGDLAGALNETIEHWQKNGLK